ncbi:ABC transporter ATP-binding protein [Lysinibacillus sp. KU-BSD001]|uniref:ABC transporter ATP-binding protein n=1 Tax=Lysinibacillus sp. KU-BSD001 TaxID=3141328 RepID=UPI0036EB4E64
MSSNSIAISVKELTKKYEVYDKPINRLKQSLYRGKKNFFREYKALDNISFKINQGETIGIVGKNGSGKSTLLQILANTLNATSGDVLVNGKVAALLELGSGFNPEYTGRENAIMNGVIMGLSEAEIKAKMPEIEMFAEIGDFIDQPVKTYSSGMFVRLAFACAINVDPDILIVDEALAVGDMKFQLKCIDKMKSFQKQGKTILFVTHDTYSVKNFCTRAIWISEGKIKLSGDVNTVIEAYEDEMKYGMTNVESPTIPQESKDNVLTIDGVEFLDSLGNKTKDFQYKDNITIKVKYTIHSEMENIVGGIALFDKQNTYICGLNTKLDGVPLPSKPGNYILQLNYSGVNLLPGTYFIDIGFFESLGIIRLDYKSRYSYFRVSSGEYFAEGIICIEHNWGEK